MHFDQLELPGQQHYRDHLRDAKESEPGTDGIPYSGYKALLDTSAEILHKAGDHLAECEIPEEGTPLYDFLEELNVQKVCFMPKGTEKEDGVSPSRSAANLRTVFCLTVIIKR